MPIKGSNDVNFHLILLKKRNMKLPLDFKVQVSMKSPKKLLSQLWYHPQNSSIPTLPNFFIETTRLSTSLEGLNRYLAQSAVELWPTMLMPVGAKIVAQTGLKRLQTPLKKVFHVFCCTVVAINLLNYTLYNHHDSFVILVCEMYRWALL